MYLPPIKKEQESPVTGIILGVVYMILAGIIFYLIFDGFNTGEILMISKHHPRYFSRHDNSGMFWSVVIGYSAIAIVSTTASLWMLFTGFRKLRR